MKMNIDLNCINDIPINTICFSDDGKTLYGFSKYYNEFFEIDLLNNKMRSLGKLENEKDVMDLVFLMIYYDKKIIFIPRMATHMHIYDCHTGSQKKFQVDSILNGETYSYCGFFYCIYGESLYLICRNPIIISKLDLKTWKLTFIKKYTQQDTKLINLHNWIGKYAACFLIDSNELQLFDAEAEELKQVSLPEECNGFQASFFDGVFVWIYHEEKSIIYKYDFSQQILYKWILQFDGNNNGLYMTFRMFDGRLYLFPNKPNVYYQIKDNEIVTHTYQAIDNDICWIAGYDGKNLYFLCMKWDGNGACPNSATRDLAEFTYRKLDLKDGTCMDIPFHTSDETEYKEILFKVATSYASQFLENMFRIEGSEYSFKDLLGMIVYARINPKKQFSLEIGKQILHAIRK
ncbi:MAG: hypothetical protein HFG14_08290 [Lachnospiraceae bacterium]|jgi:hypothetical protein|nr:hypothetical protein [Lachnospiraceae bacterium]